MRKLIILGAAVTLLAGCANSNQMFVNNSGNTASCASHGVGLIPAYQANEAQDLCTKNLRAIGYLEIEKAGAVGMMFTEDAGKLRVSKVFSNSPANTVGIKVNDILCSVDKYEVRTMREAKVYLFGAVGTTVDVSVNRGNETINYTLTRAAYPDVFGSK